MRAALDLIKGQIPARAAVDVEFHGRMLALDPTLDGQARFAVMFGSDVVSLRSRNHETTAQITGAGANEIVTYANIGDVEEGAVIAINSTEHLLVTKVEHFSELGTKFTRYRTKTQVLGVYPISTPVSFVSFPIQVIQGTDVNQTKLLVDSARALAVGDVLAVANTPAAMTYLADAAKITSVKTVFRFNDRARYLVQIDTPCVQLTMNDNVQVRVSAAYVSGELLLPELSGPYLADVIGGKTYGTSPEDITMSVTAPEDGESVRVSRNGVAISAPVKAGDLALFVHERGASKAVSEDEIIAELDHESRWGCGIDMAVAAPLFLDWLVKANSSLTLRIETDAGVEIVVVDAGTTLSVRRQLAATEKFTLRATSAGDFRIITNPMRDGVRSMRYSYVVQLTGDEVWSGAGLVLKPLLPRLTDSRAHNTDEDALYLSSGGIIL